MPDSPLSRSDADSVSRRRFLAAGGLSVFGLSMGESASARDRSAQPAVILIVLNGGASHLDTFDPKPQAPREIRGPQRAISSAIPGLHFAESLPQLAQRAHMLTTIRSLFHGAAPIHETGLQLLQVGQLASRSAGRHPSVAAEVATAFGHADIPAAIELGGPLQQTGTSAYAADAHQTPDGAIPPVCYQQWTHRLKSRISFENQSAEVQQRYGNSRFGRLLWEAGCLVASGVRFVTVHTFGTLSGMPTWDSHASGTHAPATVFTYRDELNPRFDRAASALLDDLTSSGLIEQTLVVCCGELGRTPHINEHGGRDHWPHVWSGFLAGAGTSPGEVIGESDARGETIKDRPVPLESLANLMRQVIGLAPESTSPNLVADNPSVISRQ